MGQPAASTRSAPRFALAIQRSDAPHGTNPFYEALTAGMEEALDEHGATVVLRLFDSPTAELEAYTSWAEGGDVDGAVIVDLVDGDPRLDRCRALGLPFVVLGGAAPTDASLVEVDNSAAMTMAVEFLVELGHREIARVSGPARLTHTLERTEAFEVALHEAGVTGRSLEADYSMESGARATRELLSGAGTRPTAIVYDNDLMALAGLDVARELDLTVPEQLSLLAWDDSPPCRLAEPPLSVVSRDVHELGALLARVLLDIHGGQFRRVSHAASAQIIPRGSTSAPQA